MSRPLGWRSPPALRRACRRRPALLGAATVLLQRGADGGGADPLRNCLADLAGGPEVGHAARALPARGSGEHRLLRGLPCGPVRPVLGSARGVEALAVGGAAHRYGVWCHARSLLLQE